MTVVGMLHYMKHPSNYKKAYPFAAVARMEDVDFFYFSYGDVDFKTETINGWIYDRGNWLRVVRNFPDVVINTCIPKTKHQSRIGRKLKKRTIFTSQPVGHKMKVYKRILKGEEFASYLIPSFPVLESRDILSFLENESIAVLKSYRGHHGKNVYMIEKKEKYHVQLGEEEKNMDEDELTRFVESMVQDQKWLIQPYMKCVTRTGTSYDFRLHVQKNGEGEWEINLIYPRISGGIKKISNISVGGYRGELNPFLKMEFSTEWRKVKKMLERFALDFTKHFESLYEYQFDELGIDVGLDQNRRLWLFEVNRLPGSNHREIEVAKRLLPYCKYLAKRKIIKDERLGEGKLVKDEKPGG